MPHINFRFEIRAIRDNPQRYYVYDTEQNKYIIHSFGEVQSLANSGLLNSLQYKPPLSDVLMQAEIPEICLNQTEFGVCSGDKKIERKRLDISIKPFLSGAINRLNVDDIFSTVFNFLPLGWNIDEIKVTNNLISITFSAEGTPALLPLIAPIVAAIWPLLVVVGVIILGWKLIDLLNNKEDTKQIVEKGEIAEMIESNKDDLIGTVDGLDITEEAKAKLIKLILEGDVDSLLGGTGGFTGNTAIVIALIAGVALLGFGLVKRG